MGAHRYEDAGVRDQGDALSAVARCLRPTLELPDGAKVLTQLGSYAAVLQLSEDLGIAICTDGVGTKTLVASALDHYDTIGFDCVAMNVNDIICVGARPVAMVDYLGVHTLDTRRTEQILQGLGSAAREAGVAVPGGELAQLPEVIGSDGKGGGDDKAFDLVGTCIGTVHPDRLILGRDVSAGDAILGLRSSGIHSNGLTLARRVLKNAGYRLQQEVAGLAGTLGEELLQPTKIYVRAVTGLWDAGIATKGIAHITGDGLANLCRLDAQVGYELEGLPEPPAIFRLIQDSGAVSDAEMFSVFNMGVGLVIITPESEARAALHSLASGGFEAKRIGTVTSEARRVLIPSRGLTGTLEMGFGSTHRSALRG